MTHKHLTHTSQLFEILMSLYGIWFGFITAFSLGAGEYPLWWTGFGFTAQGWFSMAFLFAGLVHALGIRLDGQWRWSPLLRLAGMTTHATLTSALAILSVEIAISGFATYAFVSVVFWVLVSGVALDLRLYLQVGAVWTKS